MEIEFAAGTTKYAPPSTASIRRSPSHPSAECSNKSLKHRFPPSVLARKIICPAYLAAPFDTETRLRFLGLHATAMLHVIKRHIRLGFHLLSLERYENGARIDLEFQKPDGGIRLNEVKSKRQLAEVDKIQAALYWSGSCDEIVLSNSKEDLVLSAEYVKEVHQRAEATRTLLLRHPDIAAKSYTPSPGTCRICANSSCPFLRSADSPIKDLPPEHVRILPS